MSNKIFTGILIGAVFSSAAALLLLKRRNIVSDIVMEEDDENEMLDKANNYLLEARNKVEEMIKDAEQKSISMLGEAGKLLTQVKEKTAELHAKHIQGIEEEANKIKLEIEQSIENFKDNNLK